MNGCQNFPEVYSFFHGFVMSIITQFPNHVAYRISLLQTALPAFILKQGREIYFWVDFQCKRKHNAKLVLIKRSLRDSFIHSRTIYLHTKNNYSSKTWMKRDPFWYAIPSSFHASCQNSVATPFYWHQIRWLGDRHSRQMTFCRSFHFFFFFFWWPRFFIVSCCSLALTSGPVSFEVKWELYTHVIFLILAYCKITG